VSVPVVVLISSLVFVGFGIAADALTQQWSATQAGSGAVPHNDRNGVAGHRGPDALQIAPEALTSAVAAALIVALNAELSARYPEPGATHFHLDPGEVAPGKGIFLVARWLGRPVGCGALRCLREPALMRELGPRVGELKRMYVAPEVRGQGIGRALLARLEAEARTLGLARLVLETGTRQAEALALYRRAGFTEIPAYGEYAASHTTSVCLAKVL
jgi:putative acetyltransferase